MRMIPKLCVLISLATFALPCVAQSGTGFPSFGSFAQREFDTINEGNLNVHFAVPVVDKPGRGMPLSYVMSYDGIIWTPHWLGNTFAWIAPLDGAWGWKQISEPVAGYVTYTTFTEPPQTCSNHNPFVVRQNYTYHTPSGTSHFMGGQAVVTDCNGASHGTSIPMTGGYSLSVGDNLAVYVVTVGGVLIQPPQFAGSVTSPLPGKMTDTNGNQITGSQVGAQVSYLDTLGTTALKLASSTSSASMTYPSPTNPATYLGVTLNYTNYTVQTSFGCAGVGEFGPSTVALVSSIVLPDNSRYLITYETTRDTPGSKTGRIASIQLPSGGTINYSYTGINNGIICADASPAGLTRTTPDGQWTYTRTVTQTGFQGTTGVAGTVTSSSTNLIDPLGNKTVINFGAMNGSSPQYMEKMRQVYTGTSTLVKTIETCYNGAAFPCTGTVPVGTNSRRTVRQELPNSSGKVSAVDTYYASNNTELVTDVYEYDFGTGAPGSLVKHTNTSYATLSANIFYDPNSPSTSYTVNIYDRPATVTVTDGSNNTVSQTTYSYDPATTTTTGTPQHVPITGSRGNPTTIAYLVQGTTTVSRTKSYFDTGTVKTETDFAANPTNYAYGTGACGNSFATSVTDALGHSRSMTWDCNGGVSTGVTDENNKATSSIYGDPNFWRLTQTSYPDGGQTAYTYNLGTTTPWSITQDVKISTTQTLTKKTVYDGLARVLHKQITSDPQGIIYVDTSYDAAGHLKSTSNPYRTTSDSTYGVTSNTTYDGLGRVTVRTQPDLTTVQTTYSANCVTGTDEAGKTRKSCSDGLGRLTQLFEDPGTGHLNYETDYQYDALGNLICAVQKGTDTTAFTTCASAPTTWRPRSFVYDLLSRLTSAHNPESGTILYTYDANGNVHTKTAPAPNQTGSGTVTTTYTYDALNRLTGKGYSDGTTPGEFYYYDVAPGWMTDLQNVVGRLANSNNQWGGGSSGKATASTYSYDAMGRMIRKWSQTPSISPGGKFSYATFDLAGNLSSSTSAAPTTISYAYDGASRLTTVTSSWPNPTTLYTVDPSLGYYPNGAIRKALFGNGLTETFAYNKRLQPCRMDINSGGSYFSQCTDSTPSGNVLDFTMGYNAGSTDNGNIISWSAVGNQTFSRSYVYDALNRIQSMSDTASGQACKGLSWTLDAWGNLTAQNNTSGTCYTFLAAVGTNNQLQTGYQYDAAGNMTYDGSHYYTYDAENHIIQVDSGSTASYVYDEYGNRVRKNTGSAWTEYFYGPNGSVEAEYNGTAWPAQYVYAGSRLITQYANNETEFVHSDHLGSTRLVTNVTAPTIPVDNLDYLPFGRQIAGDTMTTHKFTGKERDNESGNDYFGARYFGSGMGRFLSSDPLPWIRWQHGSKNDHGKFAAYIANPQNFNLYGYVLNNPLNKTDPTGMYQCNGTAEQCAAVKKGLDDIKAAAANLKVGTSGRAALDKALSFYGAENTNNGVNINFNNTDVNALGSTSTANGVTTISFGANALTPLGPTGKGETVAHEGTHGVDQKANGHMPHTFWEFYDTEYHAYQAESAVDKGVGSANETDQYPVWFPGITPQQRTTNITKDAYSNACFDVGGCQ